MQWKTALKAAGDDADAYLDELSKAFWLIKSITGTADGRIVIVACQSPEYADKRKKKGRRGRSVIDDRAT